MPSQRFSAVTDAWVAKSKARATAVFRESVQRLGERMNVPVGHGGTMPVDTGFLRSSYAVALGGLPTGPDQNPGSYGHQLDLGAVNVVLLQAKLGESIFGGWTANYAPFMEEKYGFLRLGVMSWQGIVNEVIAEAKARFP